MLGDRIAYFVVRACVLACVVMSYIVVFIVCAVDSLVYFPASKTAVLWSRETLKQIITMGRLLKKTLTSVGLKIL